jgi:hypothetical protein
MRLEASHFRPMAAWMTLWKRRPVQPGRYLFRGWVSLQGVGCATLGGAGMKFEGRLNGGLLVPIIYVRQPLAAAA